MTSSVSHTGMIYMATPHNAITSVGAGYAEEVVNEKMGIVARRGRMTEDGEYPGGRPDPLPDEELLPIGDVVWPLMLLLAGMYILYKRRRTTTPVA